jgi:signal transduction histidine kinase
VDVRAGVSEQGDALVIIVRDSGPGIPADKQATIFEPFFTTKEDGSGLGLWIVQQIISAHGGLVEVSNVTGGGAVFAVRLPLRRSATVNG